MYRINEIQDLEKVNPVESDKFQNYYIMRDFVNYVISNTGIVVNTDTGETVSTYVSHYGYIIINLKNQGVWRGHRLHRLVAMVFVGRPSRHLDKSFDQLHVNHIDGNKYNNVAENLEWCISEENNKHALDNNLTNWQKPVLIKNILTGQVTELKSVREFCDKYDVSRNYASELLLSKQAGIVTINWCVFKHNDGKPWPEVPLCNQIENSFDRISYWCASNRETGKVIVSDNLRELAQAMDMSFHKLNTAYYTDGGAMEGWEITMKREYSKRDSLERVLRRNKKRTYKLKSTNIETGEIKIHDNCEACSRDLGVKDGKSISYAVLHRSGKPYYGYTFEKLNEDHLE